MKDDNDETLSMTSSNSISPEYPVFSSSSNSDPQAKHLLGAFVGHERKPSTIVEGMGEWNDDDEEDAPVIEEASSEEKDTTTLQKSFLCSTTTTTTTTTEPSSSPLRRTTPSNTTTTTSTTSSSSYSSSSNYQYTIAFYLHTISKYLGLSKHQHNPATMLGFWALFLVTAANYVLTPLRDAIALQVGVKHIPLLTLTSTVLAFFSSVPIGWLFEAPDPNRRKMWKRMGLTRGETQGTSLALFYRCFSIILLSYAIGFTLFDDTTDSDNSKSLLAQRLGQILYVAFFLVVHLMKLHSLSLVWGVVTEAMEYEEVATKHKGTEVTTTRLQRLALVGFGGTLGGILGSVMASSMAQLLKLPGLLVLSAAFLEISAELSIELGRIMQKHWVEQQQLFASSGDLTSLDSSMKRSGSLGSMKRVASGNSLNRVRSNDELNRMNGENGTTNPNSNVNDDSFVQRLLRGITTILRSRLLMAIFTYNALYASTTVLLSFQRAALVAGRTESSDAEQDTAFLARVNMASSVAIFALQASGLGAFLANQCGPAGTLSLMPLIRLLGVVSLAWWHRFSQGQPPNLLIFLVVDEFCKIVNLSVAKPVRESLWRGLSNEARYEAKPIVDTLANRWGGGSAAFLVSFLNKSLDLLGLTVEAAEGTPRTVFGFPPVLFLCMIIASWWSVVSVDLGQIRKRIDAELKKQE